MLNIFQYRRGLQIIPVSSSSVDEQGELEVLSSDGKLYFHNGTTKSAVVTEAHTATLTNKTIDGDNNTIQDLALTSLKTVLADANKVIQRDASGIVVSGPTIPSGSGGFVRTDSTDTLTNKTIDAGSNTITNLTNSNLSGSAGITGANIASNTVANSNLTDMATQTIKGRTTAGTGSPEDLTATQATAILNSFVGDSGSGGTKGLTPAPAAGDTAANKFLKADGNWTSLPTTAITDLTGDVSASGPGSAAATVNSVGGSSAANINAAELLANAATSANTASAIVRRDGSGNFSATTITGTTSLKTPLLADNGAGLAITPTINQNLTLSTSGTGRVIINGAEGLDMGEQGTPANPSSGFSSLYFKTNHLLYSVDSTGTERLIGSGGGSGGINFLTLDTTFAAVKTDNFNAENSLGDWLAYADAAGIIPVDMTGGSPTVTITRNTTSSEVLDGSASFKVTKTASNLQGEGVSCIANIPIGYRGQRASITAPFKILSGSLVSGDLKAFLYDVTNSQVIAPYNNDVLLSPSKLTMYADIPSTCAQLRVGFHFASTSTTAVTFAFDDITIGSFQVAFGPAMTDWKHDLTFTPSAAFGTSTSSFYSYRRTGDTLQVTGNFLAGTVAGSTAYIALPSGLLIDSSKLSSNTNTTELGDWTQVASGVNTLSGTLNTRGVLFYDGSDTSNIYLAYRGSSFQLTKDNGNNFGGTGDLFSFEFFVPIVGWSTNVTSNNSQVFNISSVLANGTRVTGSAPTSLGQYRSYLKNGGGVTFTETNGSPTVAPSTADGIKIYQGGSYAGGDSSNQPTKYEIFVGKNKNISTQFYASTGKTGFIDARPWTLSASFDYGYFTDYDPTTGIFTIVANRTGASSHRSGSDSDGGNFITDTFFDIIVSENALAVQSEPNRSEVWLYTANGYGSTNTKIRRWTTTGKNIGTAITYLDSSTNGATFTINENGIYSIHYVDQFNSASGQVGISLNSAQLTTDIFSITATARLAAVQVTATDRGLEASTTLNLSAGDIIRCHTDGSASGVNTAWESFRIVKVAN